MLCNNCNKEIINVFGSGKFCTMKCSRSFSTKKKRKDINKSVSEKLKNSGNGNIIKICKYCEGNFIISWSKREQICCSRKCSEKLKWKNPLDCKNMSEKASINAKIQHSKNTGFGWKSRKGVKPSYPETIAINELDKLEIIYEREFHIGKYFIDFLIESRKIAIEIDGQQHKLDERKKIDREKDKLLNSLGYKVFRISYPEENIKESIRKIILGI